MHERKSERGPASGCPVPWSVCVDCAGVALVHTAGRARCPRCIRQWPEADVTPCPWPATVRLVDLEGKMAVVCASHAAHSSVAHWERAHELAAYRSPGP
jgi:hypothetical protein